MIKDVMKSVIFNQEMTENLTWLYAKVNLSLNLTQKTLRPSTMLDALARSMFHRKNKLNQTCTWCKWNSVGRLSI